MAFAERFNKRGKMARYKIADVLFEFFPKYKYSEKLLENYVYNGEEAPQFKIEISAQDIQFEDQGEHGFPEYYSECLAVYRKLSNYILENANGMLFHCSAIAVDGEAYLFSAPSGTGKSTHTALWRELLGEKAIMINDDKPIIRLIDGAFYVYGTPWDGKHRLSTNTRAKIKAVCLLKRGTENKIEKISAGEALVSAMSQTLLPETEELMEKFLALLEKLLASVDLYRLHCNVSLDAAKLSYTTMSEKER